MKLGALGVPAYRTFSLDEIEEATNNFDTSTFMGEGSQGQMPQNEEESQHAKLYAPYRANFQTETSTFGQFSWALLRMLLGGFIIGGCILLT